MLDIKIQSYLVCGCILLTASLTLANINFIVVPRSQAVVFGNDLYLHCLFSQTSESDYNTTVEWNLNGGKRPLNSSIFSNNTLLVSKMVASYLGNYTCVVMEKTDNSTISVSDPALIIHAYIKPFQTNPSPVSIIEGDNSSLECITGESSPPAQIYWERNNEIFLGGTQINSTFKTFIPYGLIGQFYMKLVLIGSPLNSGVFNCVARNKELGIEVKSLKVLFSVTATEKPPYIDNTLHRSNIISPRNLPLVIDCPVRGHPFPEIKWFKNNEILRFDHRIGALTNGSLYISDLQVPDDGHYTCHGENRLGTASSSQIQVRNAYLEIDFERQPYSIFAIAGQPATLPCSPPISFPLSSVVWYKNDRPLAYRSGEQSVFIVDPNNGIWDLFFSNIQKLDEGNYFCVAVNNYSVPSTRTSKVAEISVGGAPVLIQKPTDASIVKGQGVKVTCMVDGDPFPTITWLLDKLSVVIDSTVMLRQQNQELHISNINKTREGMYTCRARNIYGIVEAEAYIQVLVPPVITRKLTNTTVNLGVGVILTCDVYGDPKPDITWYKDGAKIQPTEGITLAYDRFYIKNVTLSSAGLYGCQATNKAGTVSTEAYLIVKVKPYYISGPTNRSVIMGESLTFICEVEGYPEPTMEWLYNGTQLFPPGVLVSLDSKTISISSVNWAHVGAYTCVAANMEGTSTKTGVVSLHVPPWIVDIVGNPIVYENKDMELICQISGIPIPTIQWYHYGNTITASQDGRIYFPAFNRLGIKIIQTSDAGSYSCTAGNSIGTSEKSVQVFVIEAPVPPVLSDPTVMSSTSISLTWIPATQKPYTDVTQYAVYYKEKTGIQFQRYIDAVDGTQTRFEIQNLLPGTEYMFTMAAINPAGEGGRSNIKLAKTFDSGPSEPRSLKVIVIESHRITLQWLIPQVTNGQIRKYQILYKEKSSVLAPSTVQFDVITVEASVTYTVENLKPYTEYEILVRAATVQGDTIHWGNLSTSLQIRTNAAAPAGSPDKVQVTVMSPYSVEIKWQDIAAEKQNGPIRKYHIKFWPQKSPGAVKSITVPNTELSTNITELLPWRFYSFAVEAENDGGIGPSTDTFTVRTHANAPSKAPVNVIAEPLSASVVMISIELPDPESWNSDLTGYYVEFVAMGTTNSPTSVVNSSVNSLSLNISGLNPWTNYRFRAALYTDLSFPGVGPYSNWTFAKTLQSVSGPITNINYQVTPTSITLFWNSPISPNGVITHYEVKVYAVSSVNNYEVTMETPDTLKDGSLGQRQKRDTSSIDVEASLPNDISSEDRNILISICDIVIQTSSDRLLEILIQNRSDSNLQEVNLLDSKSEDDSLSTNESVKSLNRLSPLVRELDTYTVNWLNANNLTYLRFCSFLLNQSHIVDVFDNSTLSIYKTKTNSITLSDLSPSTMYSISVSAINSAGQLGSKVTVTVNTASLPPPPVTPSTEIVTMETTSTSLLMANEYSIQYPQRIMFIIGGVIAGSVLVVLVVVLFACLCIKGNSSVKYVSDRDSGGLSDGWSQEPQFTSNSETSAEPEGYDQESGSRNSTSKIHFMPDSVKYDTHSTREPSYKQYGYMKEDTSVPGIITLPIHDIRPEQSIGIENPAYIEGASQQVDQESVAVSMTLSAEEVYSQAESNTLKRKSQMKNESAEAIAILRNSMARKMKSNDKESLINNDAVVVYTERTAL